METDRSAEVQRHFCQQLVMDDTRAGSLAKQPETNRFFPWFYHHDAPWGSSVFWHMRDEAALRRAVLLLFVNVLTYLDLQIAPCTPIRLAARLDFAVRKVVRNKEKLTFFAAQKMLPLGLNDKDRADSVKWAMEKSQTVIPSESSKYAKLHCKVILCLFRLPAIFIVCERILKIIFFGD